MPVEVSLTSFLDYAAATGEAKVRKVADAKQQYAEGYMRRYDYWRDLRLAIVDVHEQARPVRELRKLLNKCRPKQVANYTAAVEAYEKWAARKSLQSVGKRRARWVHGDLTVHVNPELVLEIDGTPHVIKLYFKRERLSGSRLGLSLHLLQTTVAKGAKACVLDVQAGKLHTASAPTPAMDALLAGEADLFVRLWNAI
jgi:hypothetical protein